MHISFVYDQINKLYYQLPSLFVHVVMTPQCPTHPQNALELLRRSIDFDENSGEDEKGSSSATVYEIPNSDQTPSSDLTYHPSHTRTHAMNQPACPGLPSAESTPRDPQRQI